MPVRVFILCLCLALLTSCDSPNDTVSNSCNETPLPTIQQPKISQNMPPSEVSLFDGKNLENWNITDFGGQGNVYTKDESIIIEFGEDLTGVNWIGPVPTMNYQIDLDAMRLAGEDFFCGLTFPIDQTSVTFVVGGWGGRISGISSINYYDASDNETTVKKYIDDNNRWYHIRARVTPGKIQCWIDEKQYVNLDTAGKHLAVRIDIRDARPLGITTWQTSAAIKNIRLTKLPDPPIALTTP